MSEKQIFFLVATKNETIYFSAYYIANLRAMPQASIITCVIQSVVSRAATNIRISNSGSVLVINRI